MDHPHGLRSQAVLVPFGECAAKKKHYPTLWLHDAGAIAAIKRNRTQNSLIFIRNKFLIFLICSINTSFFGKYLTQYSWKCSKVALATSNIMARVCVRVYVWTTGALECFYVFNIFLLVFFSRKLLVWLHESPVDWMLLYITRTIISIKPSDTQTLTQSRICGRLGDTTMVVFIMMRSMDDRGSKNDGKRVRFF